MFEVLVGQVPCGAATRGFKTRVLDPTITLFRGERVKMQALLTSPMFFSNYAVAQNYAELGCEVFRPLKQLCLFEFTVANVKLLAGKLSAAEKVVLRVYFGLGMRPADYKTIPGIWCAVPKTKRAREPRICTEGFLSKRDAKKGDYVAKKLSAIVCKHGFDGWYMPPHFKRTSNVDFHEEIVLCTPADDLEPVGTCKKRVKKKDCIFCTKK